MHTAHTELYAIAQSVCDGASLILAMAWDMLVARPAAPTCALGATSSGDTTARKRIGPSGGVPSSPYGLR